jgi:hypothetical protein
MSDELQLPLRLTVEFGHVMNITTGASRQAPTVGIEEWQGTTASGRDKWKKRGTLMSVAGIENPTLGDLLAAVGRIVDQPGAES